MAIADGDGALCNSFGLEMDGIQIKNISEVSGLKMEQDVIEYKSNTASDGKYFIRKLTGRPKAGTCTLTRALTGENSFDKWIKDAHAGNIGACRKTGAIVLYDFQGNTIKRYNLTNAWPSSLELTQLKAGDTNVLCEKLVLTYETCEPE